MKPTTSDSSNVRLSRLLLGTLGVLVCHLAAVGALILVFVVFAPRYLAMFGDRDMELPASTVMFINLASFLADYWFVLVLLLVPDGLVYCGLARLSRNWNWLATAWAMLWLLVTIAILAMTVVAVGLFVHGLMAGQTTP